MIWDCRVNIISRHLDGLVHTVTWPAVGKNEIVCGFIRASYMSSLDNPLFWNWSVLLEFYSSSVLVISCSQINVY